MEKKNPHTQKKNPKKSGKIFKANSFYMRSALSLHDDLVPTILQTCMYKSDVWNWALHHRFWRNSPMWTQTWDFKPRPKLYSDQVWKRP